MSLITHSLKQRKMIKQLLFMLKPSETESYLDMLMLGEVPVPEDFKF